MPPTGPSAKHQAKKEQILSAAAGIFARRGFAGTLMADIAGTAAVGKGTVYEYFPSKEELFFAVFQWTLDRMEAATRVSVSRLGGSAADRLRSLNRTVVAALLELEAIYGLVIEFWAAAGHRKMQERFKQSFCEGYQGYREVVTALLDDGRRRGEFLAQLDSPALAAALVGMWDALGLQTWFDPDFDARSAANAFIEAHDKGDLRMKAHKLPDLVLGALLALILTAPLLSAAGDPPQASELVRRAFDCMRGRASVSEVDMTIHRVDWQRTMTIRAWTRGMKQQPLLHQRTAQGRGQRHPQGRPAHVDLQPQSQPGDQAAAFDDEPGLDGI